ncbi:hypothetical protein BKA63DRAFT_565135 [Paraphoma chrysanthemicola]|nr:hypothetical protein BKA63DRAFT_565135 [Paraphoma chrysanthemicola]
MSERDYVSYTTVPESMVAESTTADRHPSSSDGRPVQWHVSPRALLSMLGLLVSGIIISIGHHLFYSHLNGRAVREIDGGSPYVTQTWIIRYGTAFSFLAKALLASAVVVAYKQNIWINLRSKSNTVSTIDAMFAATYDVLAVASPSLLLRAKVPALMAIITWLLPLAALITPSTLIVVPSVREHVLSLHVPTLNLHDLSLYQIRGLQDGSSPLLARLTSAMASNMEISPMPAIAPNITYQHEFVGPSLKCENATGDRLEQTIAIWEDAAGQLTPVGTPLYVAYTLYEDADGKTDNTKNLTPGNIVSQCVTGIDYDTCFFKDGPALSAQIGDEAIVCWVHDTRFKVNFQTSNQTQAIANTEYEWLGVSKESSSQGPIFQKISGSLTILLGGAIALDMVGSDPSLRSVRTNILSTALLGPIANAIGQLKNVSTDPQVGGRAEEVHYKNFSALLGADMELAIDRTLADMIEELSRNQTLSLFSSDRLWLPQNATNLTTVTQSLSYTVYEYHPRNLLMTYGIAILFSAFGVALGLRAVWLNGTCHDTSFSSIMCTTRNHYLDDITLGYSLGAAPTPHAVSKVKLRFGELRDVAGDDGGKSRAAFGLDEDIVPLRKGQVVY